MLYLLVHKIETFKIYRTTDVCDIPCYLMVIFRRKYFVYKKKIVFKFATYQELMKIFSRVLLHTILFK